MDNQNNSKNSDSRSKSASVGHASKPGLSERDLGDDKTRLMDNSGVLGDRASPKTSRQSIKVGDGTDNTTQVVAPARRPPKKPIVVNEANETFVVPKEALESGDFSLSDASITHVAPSPRQDLSTTRVNTRSNAGGFTSNRTRPRSSAITDHNEVSLGGTLNERFVLDEVLGAGGMGEVYKAKDLRRVEMQDSSPYIALKLLRAEFRSDTRFMMALQRESKKVQRLSHPNIVTVYDFDRDGDAAYISMEYLEGEPLDKVIFGKGLEKKRALRIIERMARGLAYAHQEGYVHADFKPGNIFLANTGEEKNEATELVKILDFGIAQAVIKDGSGYRNVGSDDNSEMMALTPNYASMEMLKGEQPLPNDDMYSFCCVAYELLTGKHPYADSKGKKRTAVDAQKLGIVAPVIDGLPKVYQRAFKKGVSYQRKDRFDNAGEFLDAIKPLVNVKQVALALGFGLICVFIYFGLDTWNEKRVPSLNSLEAVFSASAEKIREGDAMLVEGDIDLAHRFYAQAWNSGNDLKGLNDSLVTLRRIMDDRMNKISNHLMDEALSNEVDSFRRQQLQIALEFIKEDPLGTQDNKIQSVIDRLIKIEANSKDF